VQAITTTTQESHATAAESSADQRRAMRSQAHDLSEIILDGRTQGAACMIHNISQSGALLEVSCGELPKRFVLANYTKKTKTLCRQVWRDNRMMGVNFLTSPRPFEISK
jgi:hypothetical protein